MRQRQALLKTASYIFLIVSSFIMVYPVLFMVLGAFTTEQQFAQTIILPVPNTLNADIFMRAFNSGISASYVFTLIRVSWYIFTTLVVGVIGGYIFSKLRFPGRNKVFLLFLSGMVMPGILMLIPSYFDDGLVAKHRRQQLAGPGRARPDRELAGAVHRRLGAALRHLRSQAEF
jgi:multiple sugar transport system permease protein